MKITTARFLSGCVRKSAIFLSFVGALVSLDVNAVDYVWSGGSGEKDYNSPGNWTPSGEITVLDTVKLTAEGTDPYLLSLSGNFEADSSVFACNAPVTLDLGGHVYSNAANFTSSGDQPLTIRDGLIRATEFKLSPDGLTVSNATIRSQGKPLALSSATGDIRFDDVQIDRDTSYNNVFTMNGTGYRFRGRNVLIPDPSKVPGVVFSGTGYDVRFSGADTSLLCSLSVNGTSGYCEFNEGRFYRNGGSSYGNLTMSGSGCVLSVTNGSVSTCYQLVTQNGVGNAIRVTDGASLTVGRADAGKMSHSFAGVSNRWEIINGTLTMQNLLFGYCTNACDLVMHIEGDDAVVLTATSTNKGGFYIGLDESDGPAHLEFVTGANLWSVAPLRQEQSGRTVLVSTNITISVDAAPALDAMKKNRCKLPLMSFKSANATNINWAAFNDRLVMPKLQHGTLRLETTLNKGAFSSATLWCDIRRDVGLMIIVK